MFGKPAHLRTEAERQATKQAMADETARIIAEIREQKKRNGGQSDGLRAAYKAQREGRSWQYANSNFGMGF